ncbi:MAG: hypothetical protein AABY00_00390 [Nanoarchaeota archaeon]
MVVTYRTIGPRGIEERLGHRAAMFLFRRNRDNRSYTLGVIDFNQDGDPCLRADRYGEKIPLVHGDVIRIKIKGKGLNSIRDYVYLDESD